MAAAPVGIVLTGGLSSRMGTDKATLVVDGVRLVDRVVSALQVAGAARIVIAGPPIGSLRHDVETVADPTPEPEGPLSGIVSAWRHLGPRADLAHDPVVVVACDLPQIKPEVIAALISVSAEHGHGAVAHDGSRPQPLIAAYRTTALTAMTEAFDHGQRSVRALFGGWDLGTVPFEREALADADTPADLDAFVVTWPAETRGRASQ